MMFISRLITICLVLLVCHQIELQATSQSIEFTETTLDNGLRIVVVEDHVAPVVSMDAVPAVMPVLTAEVSFALSVRAPLLVVIFALMSMDRPACRVRSPP